MRGGNLPIVSKKMSSSGWALEARIDAPTSWPEAQNQTTAHACCCGAKRCGMLGWITAPALAYVHVVHVVVAWLVGCTVVLGGTIYLHTATSYVGTF